MACWIREVWAGKTHEVRIGYFHRMPGKGNSRAEQSGETSTAQLKANMRKRIEVLRWLINANFVEGDILPVLHYKIKTVSLAQVEADRKEFLRKLRAYCKKAGVAWKYVAWVELRSKTKERPNPHIHLVLPYISLDVIAAIWKSVAGENAASPSVTPLDDRGSHDELAAYAMEDADYTMERAREEGITYKRYTTAQGMVRPQPEYHIVPSRDLQRDPKPKAGWILLKDADGETVRRGFIGKEGYEREFMEYTELWIGEGEPPKQRSHSRRLYHRKAHRKGPALRV